MSFCDDDERRWTHPVHEVVIDLHLFAKLAPYLFQGELVVRMNEAAESYNMKFVPMLLRQVCYNIFHQLGYVSYGDRSQQGV